MEERAEKMRRTEEIEGIWETERIKKPERT